MAHLNIHARFRSTDWHQLKKKIHLNIEVKEQKMRITLKVRPGLKRVAKELNNDPMSGSFYDDRNQLLKMIKEPQFFMITNNLILSKRRRRQYLRQTRSIRTTAARRRRGLMSDQSGTPWCTLFIKHTFKTPERVCVCVWERERERKREREKERGGALRWGLRVQVSNFIVWFGQIMRDCHGEV